MNNVFLQLADRISAFSGGGGTKSLGVAGIFILLVSPLSLYATPALAQGEDSPSVCLEDRHPCILPLNFTNVDPRRVAIQKPIYSWIGGGGAMDELSPRINESRAHYVGEDEGYDKHSIGEINHAVQRYMPAGTWDGAIIFKGYMNHPRGYKEVLHSTDGDLRVDTTEVLDAVSPDGNGPLDTVRVKYQCLGPVRNASIYIDAGVRSYWTLAQKVSCYTESDADSFHLWLALPGQ